MENIVEENIVLSSSEKEEVQEEKPVEIRLVDVVVANEGVALNLLVAFLSLAQRRGVFTMEESAKIWECVKQFQKTA
jgi:hypothetical protein